MPVLISTRNIFFLIILGALIIGGIGIITSLINAERPSNSGESERPVPQTTSAEQTR